MGSHLDVFDKVVNINIPVLNCPPLTFQDSQGYSYNPCYTRSYNGVFYPSYIPNLCYEKPRKVTRSLAYFSKEEVAALRNLVDTMRWHSPD